MHLIRLTPKILSVLLSKRLIWLKNPDLNEFSGKLTEAKTAFDQEVRTASQAKASLENNKEKTQDEIDREGIVVNNAPKALTNGGGAFSNIGKAIERLPSDRFTKQVINVKKSGDGRQPGMKIGLSETTVKVSLGQIVVQNKNGTQEKVSARQKAGEEWDADIKVVPSGSASIVSVSNKGQELCALLIDEKGDLVNVMEASGAMTGKSPNTLKLEGDVKALPFGNSLIVQAGNKTPNIIDVGGTIKPGSLVGETIGNNQIVRLEVSPGNTQVGLGIDSQGNVLTRVQGSQVRWSDKGQFIVNNGTPNVYLVYEPMITGSGSAGLGVALPPEKTAEVIDFHKKILEILDQEEDLGTLETKLGSLKDPENLGSSEAKRITQVRKDILDRIGRLKQEEVANTAQRARDLEALERHRGELRDEAKRIAEETRPTASEEQVDFMLGQVARIEQAILRFQTQKQAGLIKKPGGLGTLPQSEEGQSRDYIRSQITDPILKPLQRELADRTDREISSYTSLLSAFHTNCQTIEARRAAGETIPHDEIKDFPGTIEALDKMKEGLLKLKTALNRATGIDRQTITALNAAMNQANDELLESTRNLVEGFEKQAVNQVNKDKVFADAQSIRSAFAGRVRRITPRSSEADIEAIRNDLEVDVVPLRTFIDDAANGIKHDADSARLVSILKGDIERSIDRIQKSNREERETQRGQKHDLAEDTLRAVLKKMERAKNPLELEAVSVGIDLNSGDVTEADLNENSRILSEAIKYAKEAGSYGDVGLLSHVLNAVKAKKAVLRTSVEQNELINAAGNFEYRYEGWNGSRGVEVPGATSRPVGKIEVSGAHWDDSSGMMTATIPGIEDIVTEDERVLRFTIAGSSIAEGVAGYMNFSNAEHFRPQEQTITTPETFAFKIFQEHWGVNPPSKLMDTIILTLKKHENDSEEVRHSSIAKALKEILVKRYSEKLITDDNLNNTARIFLKLLEVCRQQDPGRQKAIDAICTDNSSGKSELIVTGLTVGKDQEELRSTLGDLYNRYQRFNSGEFLGLELKETMTKLIDDETQRIRDYHQFVQKTTGLEHFKPKGYKPTDFSIGGLQVARVEKIMTARTLAKDPNKDMKGYVLIGQPGSGKTKLQEHLERVERGRSTWINGKQLKHAVSWDPWDPKNGAEAKAALLNFFFGMVCGWNVTIDEAHGINPALLEELKTVAQQNGVISTVGSPVDNRFGQFVPPDNYRVHDSSVLVLLMNHERQISKGGQLEDKETQTSTKEAIAGRRMDWIDLDTDDLKMQPEMMKDYLRRASLRDGIPEKTMKVMVDKVVTGADLITADFPEFDNGRLEAIQKLFKNRLIVIQTIVEIQAAVLRNGTAKDGLSIEPACYMTAVGGNDLDALTKDITAFQSETDIQSAVESYLERKHASKPNVKYKNFNLLWIRQILHEGELTQRVAWNEACIAASDKRKLEGSDSQEAFMLSKLSDIIIKQHDERSKDTKDLRAEQLRAAKATADLNEVILKETKARASRPPGGVPNRP